MLKIQCDHNGLGVWLGEWFYSHAAAWYLSLRTGKLSFQIDLSEGYIGCLWAQSDVDFVGPVWCWR